MPEKGSKVKFENYYKQLPVPFVIYADFEAITEKIEGCQLNDVESFTQAYQNDKDCSYGYKVVCCYDGKYTKPAQAYRGENAVYLSLETILEEVKYCERIIKNNFNKPLKMTKNTRKILNKLASVIFVMKNIITMMFVSVIIVMWLENIGTQLMMIVILIFN